MTSSHPLSVFRGLGLRVGVPALFALAATAQAPVVTATDPLPQARACSASQQIRITFDRPLSASSLGGAVRATGRWSGENPVASSLASNGRVLVIDPQRPFFPGELVTVWLKSTILSTAGLPMNVGHALQFWVRVAPSGGQFHSARVIPLRRTGETGLVTYGIHPGDVNGDGAPDIIASNERAHDVRILLSDGCSQPGPMTVITDPNNWPSPTEGIDMDGDGDMDLITGNAYSNNISVYLNGGGGSFSSPTVYAAGGFVHGIAALDMDGDGDLDVVAPNTNGVAVYANQGNGTLGTPTVFTGAGNGEDNVHVGDADNDGILDIFVGCLSGRNVAILKGDGAGGFTVSGTQSTGSGNPFQIAVGDLDGDGFADAVTANRTGDDALRVHFGDGTGGFRGNSVRYATGQRPTAVDLGDLDGDGDLDCVVSCFTSGDYRVYWNNGSGVFTNGPTLPASQAGSCATLVDFDRDGILDILAADEASDDALLFLQRCNQPAGTQAPSCDGTLRVDNLASRGGFGTAATPIDSGRRVYFSVTGPPNVGFAILAGERMQPGLVLPWGQMNLDPVAAGGPVIVVDGLFGPANNTDANGEAVVDLLIPTFLPIGSTVTLQAAVAAPGGLIRITNAEEVRIR